MKEVDFSDNQLHRMPRSHLCILACIVILGVGDLVAASCEVELDVGFGSSDSCFRSQLKKSPIRIAYLDKQYVTQNQAAIDKIKSMGLEYNFGRTCESAATAIPEW